MGEDEECLLSCVLFMALKNAVISSKVQRAEVYGCQAWCILTVSFLPYWLFCFQ